MRRFSPTVIFAALLTLPGPSATEAQVPDPVVAASAPQPGSEHSYIGIGAETVNPADGQVSFDLPIQTSPGRGLSFPFGIRFNAAENWHLTIAPPGNTGAFQWTAQPGNGMDGWSYDVPYLAAEELATQVWTTMTNPGGNSPIYTQHQCDGASNFVFRGFDGRQYTLGLGAGSWNDEAYQSTNPEDCIATNYSFRNSSNNHGILATYPAGYTGWPIFPPVTVVDQSGTTYQFSNLGGTYTTINPNYPSVAGGFAQSITDRNGNQITRAANGYKDTLGRSVVSWDSNIGNSTNRITVSGLSSNIVVHWSSGSVGGANYPMGGYMQSGTATCTVPTTGPAVGNEGITEIDYPNGQSYKFAYNSTYGTISQITFPDGGFVSYNWGLNRSGQTQGSWWLLVDSEQTQESCNMVYDVPVITDRWVNDGQKYVLHQQFSYCTNGITGTCPTWKQTTVTTYDLVSGLTSITVYGYGGGAIDIPPFFPSSTGVPVEVSVADQDGSGNTLKTLYQNWWGVYSVTGSQTVLDNGQTTTELRCFDGANEQVTQVYEYGFPSEGSYPGDPSPCLSPTSQLSLSFGLPATKGPLRRKTVTAYHNFIGGSPSTHIVNKPDSVTVYDGSGIQAKQTTYAYDGSSVVSSGAQTGLTSPPGLRGNATSVTDWLNTGTSPVTTYTYYDTGQVASKTDPCGNSSCSDITGSNHTTTYSYADSFATGTPPGQTNAYLTTVTDPLGHTRSFSWNYANGLLANSTDENSQLTKYFYETLNRLSEVDYPDQGKTTITYGDTPPAPTITILKYTTSTAFVQSQSIFDGIGHTRKTELLTDPDGTTYTRTAYDGFGRPYQLWNPTRCDPDTNPSSCSGETTFGITTQYYDSLGRNCLTVPPDGTLPTGAPCPTTRPARDTLTSYVGPCTTVTDENGASRKSCTDGLGFMTGVWEDPSGLNYESDYAYDTDGNLLSVNQKGGSANSANWRTRSFTYDSLSRLLCAANPEIQIVTCPASATGTFPFGAETYAYDANGNLVTRIMPKEGATTGTPVTTHTYTYDALNRLLTESHTDPASSPEEYSYDGVALTSGCGQNPPTITATNVIGRRSAMCAQRSGSSWSYDPMGRPILESTKALGSTQTVLNFNYSYYLDGSLNTIKYPSSDTLTYIVGGAERPTQVSDSNNNTFVSSAHYAPHGELAGMNNGSQIVTSNLYNSRLQPLLFSAAVNGQSAFFSLCYDFHLGHAINNTPCQFSAHSTGDNGNIFQVFNNVSTDATHQTVYQYDALNRLATANTATTGTNCWTEIYTIDPWSNLTNRSGNSGMGGCNTEALNAPATTQNHLTGLSYDLAGNVLNDALGNPLTFDSEDRISTDAGYTYYYDADGSRMERANGSTGTMYWPGPGGILTETDLTGAINEEYVFFNGERLARIDRPSGSVHYYFSDQVNSASVITDASGNVQERYFYYPYGGLLYSTGSDSNRYKFTGKERDAESGLDDFPARYYGSTMGRFMSPDPMGGHLEDPQTLNRYAYARNNPTSLTDPTGLDFYLSCQHTDNNGSTCQQMQVGTDKNGNAQMAWVQGQTGDNGFTATQIGNDANGNLVDRTTGTGAYTADVTGSGVQLSNGGASATGVFLNKDVDLSGTNQVQSYDTVVRAGNMPGFLFTFQNSKMEANQNAAGFFTFDGTMHDAGEVLNSAHFHYMGPIGLNWGSAEYRSWEDSSGRSGHFNLEWSKTNPIFNVPTVGDMHFGEHNPLQSPREHRREQQQ